MTNPATLIRFKCPQCNVTIKCHPRDSGRDATCPKCNASLRVPNMSPEPVVPMVSSLETQPFDFKGDVLGMSLSELKQKYLSDFKRKYHREIPDDWGPEPWCSDEPPRIAPARKPGEPPKPLPLSAEALRARFLTEEYYAEVGLVNCRLDWLYIDSDAPRLTVAGVPTNLFLYEFVDERLFRIRVTFENDGFDTVRDAFSSKYGTPTEQAKCFVWVNEVSTILLKKGRLKRDSSILIFTHTELSEVAESRLPGPSVHDI